VHKKAQTWCPHKIKDIRKSQKEILGYKHFATVREWVPTCADRLKKTPLGSKFPKNFGSITPRIGF